MMNKLFIISALFLCASGAAENNVKNYFDAWKLKYNRSYKSKAEEDKAFNTWTENGKIVLEANSVFGGQWKAGLGKFADLSSDEFSSKILMSKGSASVLSSISKSRKVFKNKIESVPTSFDWRTDGNQSVVTTVKDQGTVGSCWAFSTIGNIEGQWALAGNTLTDLSPEFLVDCDGTHDETHADCSVFGGWPYLAYDFVISANGVPSEVSYPYCSGTGDCYPCMQGPISLCGPPAPNCNKNITAACPNMVPTAKISSWTALSTDEDDIAFTLYSQGPLSVLLDATQLQYYQSGIWNGHVDAMPVGCSKTSLNHAVLLVGYGVSEEGVKFWTVKNSWGVDYGEDGYFRIERGVGMCGINTAVTTSSV